MKSVKPARSSGEESAAAEIVPAEVRRLLGEPLLYPGESVEEFYEMLAQVAAWLKPKGIEWIWVWEFTNLTVEIWRLRRLKAAWFWREQDRSLNAALDADHKFEPQASGYLYEEFAQQARRIRQELRQKARSAFDAQPFKPEIILATTLNQHHDFLDRIDDRIEKSSLRCDVALRELERSRDKAAERLKRRPNVEDLELVTK